MAYFLKKSTNKKGLYLQIYESFYDPTKKQTAHRSIKAIGYEHELRDQGFDDPIAFWQQQVKDMNAQRDIEKVKNRVRKISCDTPERMLGHFPLKAVHDALDTRHDLVLLQLMGGFKFSLHDMLCDLIYARACDPCSKSKTYNEVLPCLYGATQTYSLDQLYRGLEYLGSEYEKVIEIYNAHVDRILTRDTSHTYFDCTNFYFEIDAEDAFRKKGPSKERRADPLVSMGLLLDGSLLPLNMKLFSGNESEKPVLRESLQTTKQKCHIKGKTVCIADKGLNCADNIYSLILQNDGYIFSKSPKQLPKKELAWVFNKEGWTQVYHKDKSIAYEIKSVIDEFPYTLKDADGHKKEVFLKEKRIVTFNPSLQRKQLQEISRQVERARSLRVAGAKRQEYGDCAKYVSFNVIDENGEIGDDSIVVSLNHEAIARAKKFAGYNMIVTSEIAMKDQDIYDIYHNLWRIEESFKQMKSQLDARPVYLQKQETITAHFLICYLAVLLERIFQFKVLNNTYSTEDITNLIKNYRIVEESANKFINISRSSELLDELEKKYSIPVNNYYLTKKQVDSILNCKILSTS